MLLLLVVTFALALCAAVRGIYSPCGLSMLSTITPLAERARGRRYGTTAAWFVAGGLLGGLALGALAAAGALVVGALGLDLSTRLAFAAAACAAGAAVDAGVFGAVVPFHRRQVDDAWLSRYRSWVYGIGFGAQIGAGLATYIMTAAVVGTVVLAALSGEPLAALAVGAVFGTTRGLAVLLGARITGPESLRRFHAGFDRWREPVRRGLIVAQALALACLSIGAFGVGPASSVGLAAATGLTILALRPSGPRPLRLRGADGGTQVAPALAPVPTRGRR